MVDRWSFYTGGRSIQVVVLYRWSSGGRSIQVVVRWSFYTGGRSIQVVVLYRWLFSTGGCSIQVVVLYRWSFYTGGCSIQVVVLYRRLLDRLHCMPIAIGNTTYYVLSRKLPNCRIQPTYINIPAIPHACTVWHTFAQ